MLTTRYRAFFLRFAEPPARLFIRLGFSPSALTLLGLALVFMSCLWLLMTRRILSFCVLATLACLFDTVDGTVARITGRVSAFGAYLDAVCDRYAEAAVVTSVAWVTGYWALSMVGLAGGLLISYTKARAAMEASISNLEWPDLMERAERDVMYVVGLALGQLVSWRPLGHDLFWWTLVLLVILVHATAIQRILRAKRIIEARAG